MKRVLALLHSTLPRESRRQHLVLVRVAVIFGCTIAVHTAFVQQAVRLGVPHALENLLNFSQILAISVALWLGGDSAGDLRSGLLDALFLTGTTPMQWLVVRIVQMWIGFLSVWLVLAPFGFFAYSFGGVSLESISVSVLLLLTGFLALSSLALLASIKAHTRNQVFVFMLLALLVWEIVLWTPWLAARVLTSFLGSALSASRIEQLETFGRVGVFSGGKLAIVGSASLRELWPTVALHCLVAVLLLARCWFLLAACARGDLTAADVDSSPAPGPVRLVRRRPRRSWQDAFAWQAYCIHGLGRRAVKAKSIAYAVITAGLALLVWTGFQEAAAVIAGSVAGLMLVIAIDKPSDCIKREIRDGTMPMLLLTPHDLEEILAGWQRGAMRLAYPDVSFWVAATLAAFLLGPAGPIVVFTIGAVLLCSGPFWCLWSLMGFSSEGIFTAGTLVVTAVLTGVGCCWLAAVVHPLLLPFTAIPAAYLFNRMLRKHVLRYWMQRNIERIV